MASDNSADKANGANNGAAGPLPLFYTKPTPLDKQKHQNMALKKDFGLGFTKGINAVPVNLVEMPQVSHSYPIGFSPDGNATPVAIMGLRDSENLFLDGDQWLSDHYIPAYIRRYPFIFSEIPGGEQLSLCIDMTDEIIEEGGEQKFFDDKGEATPLAQHALEFCKSYHAAAQHTIEFSKAIAASGILVDRQAEIAVGNDKKINFSGFQIIDEKKFAELDDATFMEWRKKGWLPFIYAHLFSGAQWQRLTGLLNTRIEKE